MIINPLIQDTQGGKVNDRICRQTAGRCGLVVGSELWDRRDLCSKPDSTEDSPCMWACCTLPRPAADCGTDLWRGSWPAQALSSSSDCGSK
ncbi:hypothetical protein AVEN_143598-1 [Araneus ventricosus]|uniref:Uncharacterized protein n=1 Tax=Araneus ventricosus TaxID=182803 RepID=A0A4Y2AP40_ARAVE|nr:hypothetical protein AVEN_143598-1 [Araneus ventricosus]